MRRGLLPALALLALLMPIASLAQVPADPQWWGPTGPTEGHHMRVLLEIRNTQSYPMTNAPVLADLDLTSELIRAGWTHVLSGDRDVLQSFELDFDSIRVVAMTNAQTPRPGSSDGLVLVHDPTIPAGDQRRNEVPHLAFEGSLTETGVRYDARTQPTVSLVWRVPGTLAPNEVKTYAVYFDVLANGQHEARDYSGFAKYAELASLFGPGPGTRLVGHVVPTSTNPGVVTIIGMHADTTVRVFAIGAGGVKSLIAAPAGLAANPSTISADQAIQVFVSSGSPTSFEVEADKPVLAYVRSSGFIPSTQGTPQGSEFVFPLTYGPQASQDTVYAATAGTRETLVEVTSLSDPSMEPRLFQMLNGGNIRSYTKSKGISPADENCEHPLTPDVGPPLPVGVGLYRARVTNGGPVQLQFQHVGGMAPVPDTTGLATGTEFVSGMSWSGVLPGGSGCQYRGRNAVWQAVAYETLTTMNATSPEFAGCCSLLQIDPRGNDGNPYPPSRAVGPAPGGFTGQNPAQFPNRPLYFNSVEPVWLFTGLAGPVGGPLLGAEGARRFASPGPAMVYAPFADTNLDIVARYSQSGQAHEVRHVAAHGTQFLDSKSTSDLLTGFSLASNRPVVVIPLRADSGALAGEPSFLSATPLRTDYRGYLIDLFSESGQDPVTSSTTGAAVTYRLRLQNHARGVLGEGLHDTVDIAVNTVPGWTATLNRQTVNLGPDEEQAIELTVVPGASATPGDAATFQVTATSRTGPDVRDTLQAVTYLRRSFDVGAWFNAWKGDRAWGMTTATGIATEYTVFVQNLGTVADVIQLRTTTPDPGWNVQILRGGVELRELSLASKQVTTLTMRVTPPPSLSDGVLITTFTASSVSSPNMLANLVATTKIRAPANVEILVENTTGHALPGSSVEFTAKVINTGRGTTEVEFELRGDGRLGWAQPELYAQGPLGQRIAITQLVLGPGDQVPIVIVAKIPAAAGAGNSTSLQLRVDSRSLAEPLSQHFLAIAQANHTLVTTISPTPLTVTSHNLTATFTMRISNEGNVVENLLTRWTKLPAEWNATFPQELLVPINGTQQATGILRLAPQTPDGTYKTVLTLVSEDGAETNVNVTVLVGAVGQLSKPTPLVLQGQPGQPVAFALPVSNAGNVPLEFTVQAALGEPWELTPARATGIVQPGATIRIPLEWSVPRIVTDGSTVHQLVIVPSATAPAAGVETMTLDTTVQVGRPELRFSRIQAIKGPAGTLLQTTVTNEGTRVANNFTVDLLANAVLDSIVVAELAPGSSVDVTLLQARRSPVPVLFIDSSDQVVEANEDNNQAALPDPTDGQGIPGPGFAPLVAVTALALWRHRRSRGA